MIEGIYREKSKQRSLAMLVLALAYALLGNVLEGEGALYTPSGFCLALECGDW